MLIVFLFCVFFLSIFNCRISYKKCSIYKPDAIANLLYQKKIIIRWNICLHKLFFFNHETLSCELACPVHVKSCDLFMWNLCDLLVQTCHINTCYSFFFHVKFWLGTVGYDKILLVFFFFSYRSIIYSIYLYSKKCIVCRNNQNPVQFVEDFFLLRVYIALHLCTLANKQFD